MGQVKHYVKSTKHLPNVTMRGYMSGRAKCTIIHYFRYSRGRECLSLCSCETSREWKLELFTSYICRKAQVHMTRILRWKSKMKNGT
jgi:hypothetical protein